MEEEDIFKALYTRACNCPMATYVEIEYFHRHIKLIIAFLENKIKLKESKANELHIDLSETNALA
jgi:hypothetical protein